MCLPIMGDRIDMQRESGVLAEGLIHLLQGCTLILGPKHLQCQLLDRPVMLRVARTEGQVVFRGRGGNDRVRRPNAVREGVLGDVHRSAMSNVLRQRQRLELCETGDCSLRASRPDRIGASPKKGGRTLDPVSGSVSRIGSERSSPHGIAPTSFGTQGLSFRGPARGPCDARAWQAPGRAHDPEMPKARTHGPGLLWEVGYC